MTGVFLIFLLGPGFARMAFLSSPHPEDAPRVQTQPFPHATASSDLQMQARMGGAAPSLNLQLSPQTFPGTLQVQLESDPENPLLSRARLFRFQWVHMPWTLALGWFPQPSLMGPAREIEGATFAYQRGDYRIQGYTGQPRSRLEEQEIPLTPHVPGPYPIPPAALLPGASPTFWLRGQRLGESDLQLDRIQQTLTLSPDVDIRPGDRLRVVYHVQHALSRTLEGGLQLRSPGLDLRMESRLSAPDSSLLPDAYVGPGAGAYILDGDHFVYVGPGRGDRAPVFVPAPEGEGAYRYDPLARAVVYAGPGRGNLRVLIPASPGSGGGGRLHLQWRSMGAEAFYGQGKPHGLVWAGPPFLRLWYATRETLGLAEPLISPLRPLSQGDLLGIQAEPFAGSRLLVAREQTTGALQTYARWHHFLGEMLFRSLPEDTGWVFRLGRPAGVLWEVQRAAKLSWKKMGIFLNFPGFQLQMGFLDSLGGVPYRAFADVRFQGSRMRGWVQARESSPIHGMVTYTLGRLQFTHLRVPAFALTGPLAPYAGSSVVDTQKITWKEAHILRWGRQEIHWESLGSRRLLRLHLGDALGSLEGTLASQPGERLMHLRLENTFRAMLGWMDWREDRVGNTRVQTSTIGMRLALRETFSLLGELQRWMGSLEGDVLRLALQWVGPWGMGTVERAFIRGESRVSTPGWNLQLRLHHTLNLGSLTLRLEGYGLWMEGQAPSPGIRVETRLGEDTGRR